MDQKLKVGEAVVKTSLSLVKPVSTSDELLNATMHRPVGPTMYCLAGRGRVGKSTYARWMVDCAVTAGRPLTVLDADRNNSTLSSFVEDAIRPNHADDLTMSSYFEEQTEILIQRGGNMLVDLGGGDRVFASVAQHNRFFQELPRLGVEIVVCHFDAGGRDDLETMVWMEEMGLSAPKTLILFNEGLAPRLPNGADPFAVSLNSETVKKVRDRGGKIVRIPPVALATMTEADKLFVHFSAAANGKVPCDEFGKPEAGARPLGLWRQFELRRWLDEMKERHVKAGVAEWLP